MIKSVGPGKGRDETKKETLPNALNVELIPRTLFRHREYLTPTGDESIGYVLFLSVVWDSQGLLTIKAAN